MGIEGQFAGLAARTRRQPAFVRGGRGKGYLSDIGRFAMLERDQEYQLAKRWREHGDRDAADQLVASHLRLAAKIAMGYRGYGLPVSEIISEGNVGLMQALNRFEPEKGFRFRDLRDVVDPGLHTGLHIAFVVTCENRHDHEPEEAILQTALGKKQDRCAGKRRPAS